MAELVKFAVALSNPGAYEHDEWIEFYDAEDTDHAREQAEDANSSAKILCVASVPNG